MSVVYIVLPLALVFAAIFVGAFIWAVRRGQLDDLETPAIRVAFEDLEAVGRTRETAVVVDEARTNRRDEDHEARD
ncbi:MAG: cbb3-type cytochrome oxidase assembly protein CcoS [Deltaproteobacteria bacterium]|nr:cbb3-type cytochrome oxidase assembly protein CcoS [Deltaproteobacteria bacterium]